jgi:ABC-type transport system involved in cytochrome c biogenesis permease component
MLNKYWNFFIWEMKILHYDMAISLMLFSFNLCTVVILPFLLSQYDLAKYGLSLILFINILSIILAAPIYLMRDNDDGCLEQMIIGIETSNIIIVKFFALVVLAIIISLLLSPVIMLLYSIDLKAIIIFLFSEILAIIFASSLAINSAIIKLYFANNNEYVSLLSLPMVIPILILSSMAISTASFMMILMMVGINLVFVPLVILFNSYLLKNLYRLSVG